MPRKQKPVVELDEDQSWRKVKITPENWREVLAQEANEAIHRGLHDADWFPQAKIAIGVKRGIGEFTIDGGGDTNNFFFGIGGKGTEELRAEVEILKRQLEAAKTNAGRTVEAGQAPGDGAGVVSAADRGGDRKVTALLAPPSHQNI